MDKRAEFNEALKASLKNKDAAMTGTVRLIMAALKDRDISARGAGKADGIEESEILSMLQGMIKQRQESAKMYADAGREDLATKEESEIKIIQGFLPKQMDEAELVAVIEGLVKETGAAGIKDMGKVMNALKAKYAGQADMAKAGAIVKQKLG